MVNENNKSAIILENSFFGFIFVDKITTYFEEIRESKILIRKVIFSIFDYLKNTKVKFDSIFNFDYQPIPSKLSGSITQVISEIFSHNKAGKII